MPWDVRRRGEQWCVFPEGSDTPVDGGCHDSEGEAEGHRAALYANVPEAQRAAVVVRRVQRCADDCECMSCTGHQLGRGFIAAVRSRAGAARAAAVATLPLSDPVPVPEYPPAEWFERPTWVEEYRAQHAADAGDEQIMRLTVTDDGRVGGYFYERDVCIVDRTATLRPGGHECWSPPPSPTNYARFHQQEVVTEGGQLVRVGAVGNVGGHQSPFMAADTAAARYADPNAQLIVARIGDDERGGWLAGAAVPGATWRDVALLRRSALSGDWRWFAPDDLNPRGGYDCLGPTLVTRPGLALARVFRPAAARPVFLGGCGGVALPEGEATYPAGDEEIAVDEDEETTQALVASVNEGAMTMEEAFQAAASGSTSLPLSDQGRAWDSGAARRRLRGDSDTPSQQYRAAHFFVDGPADQFSSYHLPFADLVDGQLTAVWRGVTAAAAAVRGARGASGARFAPARPRIAAYYRKARTKFGDDSITPPWEGEGQARGASVEITVDGTSIEVPEGYELAHLPDGSVAVRQSAAAPVRVAQPDGEQRPPGENGEEEGSIEQRVSRLEAAVQELAGMIKAAQGAAVDAQLDPLGDPPALPEPANA